MTGRALYSVSIRGVTYRSAQEAADALGVSRCAVYSALSRGRPDVVGLGPGKQRPMPTTAWREITIGGMTFASLSEASRALGCCESYISNVLRVGGERAQQNLLREAMTFAARRAAARAAGEA
ncbi:hypothetical protein FGG78_22295 [Thioclava sp. BHET1]|nr:hypothetical protein FGG78_22295 [Thioclava sp. BHET1]